MPVSPKEETSSSRSDLATTPVRGQKRREEEEALNWKQSLETPTTQGTGG